MKLLDVPHEASIRAALEKTIAPLQSSSTEDFYLRTTLRPSLAERNQTPVPVADLKSLAIYVAQAIDCLLRLYDGMNDDSEYVTLLVRILNTENRVLVNTWGGMPLWDAYMCRIPAIIVERRLPLRSGAPSNRSRRCNRE